MREIQKRPRAREDLNQIWHYTYKQWGEDQADRYLLELGRAILQLGEKPECGKSREAIGAGYWSIRSGRHVIFYKFTAATVSIRRVLHDQMDVDRHL